MTSRSAPPSAYREKLVLVVQPHALVCLNHYPFAAAHLLVVPRRHVADLEELPAEEYDALMRLLRDATARLRSATRPDGLNVGFNLGKAAGAGIAEHLHAHVVPRWNGDTNFMPVLADVRVMPEYLDDSWRRLAPAFADLPGEHADLTAEDAYDAPGAARALPRRERRRRRGGRSIAAHEVMLPFVLALVIAYVLTPLVAMAERRKLPRAAGGPPRLRGRPRVARRLRPRRRAAHRAGVSQPPRRAPGAGRGGARRRGCRPSPSGCARSGFAPPAARGRGAPEPAPTSAFVARPQPDGSLAIDVGTGVVGDRDEERLARRAGRTTKKGEPFDPNRLIAEARGQELRLRAGELARDRARGARPRRRR